jgi:hypothetical protein
VSTLPPEFDRATPSLWQFIIDDPTGGLVNGGGRIKSPLGTYQAKPVLPGKATFRFNAKYKKGATFGFTSKYKKGANVPTGQTEFQFRVANLNFHSDTYQWLVVAGARAQFKGTGTINRAGQYGFMLTAIDGQVSGGGGYDKFRIKIWDVATEEIVYDNELAAPDDADPTTVIQGGSIVIHKQ